MMTVIEMQTMEGGRLDWVAVFGSTNESTAFKWVDQVHQGFDLHDPMRPKFRVTSGLHGPATGWVE